MIIMSKTYAKYNWFNTGFPVVYDKVTTESLIPMFPVVFEDDFLGGDILFPATGTVEPGTPWSTLILGNGVVGKVADEINGVASLAITAAASADIAALDWNDQESLSLNNGLIFEARVAISVLPTQAVGGTTEIVFGIAGAHNAVLDTVDCNAWFRVQHGSAALLWETDDNVTNDDDNDTGIVLVAGVYHIYRIDANNIAAVKFYVDGVLVGTGSMAGLVTPIWCVQPYFNVSKTNAGNTGVGTMLVDYVKVFQDRS